MSSFSLSSCFISNFTAFLASFLVPILLVLVFNTIIFIMVIAVLVRHAIRQSNQHQKKIDIIQMMANITGVVFLFGLTWIFGAFTILKADQAFQLIFTVTNSFQGFLIFILFCVLNSDVRLVWTKTLNGKCFASLKSVTSSKKQGTLIRGMQSSDNKCKVEHDEIKMQDTSGRLTRTFSRYKRHMNEVVELIFQNDDTAHQGVDLTQEISTSTLSPSDEPSNTFSPSSLMSIQLVDETIINYHTSEQQSESEL